jgi:putative ABC transport system ATP-binding protein
MDSNEPLLTVDDLGVDAGDRPLLRGVDIEISPGDRLAVFGPSGCGKTSLLRVIAGLDDPASGTISFHETTPDALGWPKYRRHVVYVHQRPVMLDASVRENLERPLRYRAVDRRFDEIAAVALLREAQLDAKRLDQAARSLSIGEQQRVSLVRALLVEPEVVLLDEPTSALDEASRDALERMIRFECDERGLAAMIVTHDAAQAGRLCERRLDLMDHRAGGGGEGTADA